MVDMVQKQPFEDQYSLPTGNYLNQSLQDNQTVPD